MTQAGVVSRFFFFLYILKEKKRDEVIRRARLASYYHYNFANGTFVVLLWYKLNYSPFSSIFVVLCLFYHSVSGIFWDFDGNSK